MSVRFFERAKKNGIFVSFTVEDEMYDGVLVAKGTVFARWPEMDKAVMESAAERLREVFAPALTKSAKADDTYPHAVAHFTMNAAQAGDDVLRDFWEQIKHIVHG